MGSEMCIRDRHWPTRHSIGKSVAWRARAQPVRVNRVQLWDGIYESTKQVCPWRCTHLRQGRCLSTGRLALQMREYLVDYRLVLDRAVRRFGNNPGLAVLCSSELLFLAVLASLMLSTFVPKAPNQKNAVSLICVGLLMMQKRIL